MTIRLKNSGAQAVLASLLIGLFLHTQPLACSDVMLKTEGQQQISCRTMDFSYALGSKIVVVPRNQACQSVTPEGKKGLVWTSRYGFVGISVQDLPIIADGLNEKGLSAGILWLEGTEYPKPSADEKSLAIEDSLRWILGNFATVKELKDELNNVEITGHYIEAMHLFPPLHIAVHDAQGQSLVIEFLGGQMKVYDNENGVLTNEPDFEYQTKNLEYRNWKLKLDRAAVGIPGEWYPVARFIRASIVREVLPAPETKDQAVAQGAHILNTVQVQYKAPGTDSEGGTKGAYDHTLWSLIRDHKNLGLYYRSMNNQSLQLLDLTALDFSGKTSYEPISVNSGNWFIPVSLKTKNDNKAVNEK